MTYARQNDPTAATGNGPPPHRLTIGSEGKADVKDGNQDYITATLAGKVSGPSGRAAAELTMPAIYRGKDGQVRLAGGRPGGGERIVPADDRAVLPGGPAAIDVRGPRARCVLHADRYRL